MSMRKLFRTTLQYLVVLVPALTSSTVHCSTASSSAVSVSHFMQRRHPLKLSDDGRSIVYVDPQGVLTKNNTNPQDQSTQRFRIPQPVAPAPAKLRNVNRYPRVITALSLSRAATTIAIRINDGCVGIVTFPEGAGIPDTQWIALSGNALTNAKNCFEPDSAFGNYPTYAETVSISPNGRQIALENAGKILIIDIATRKILRELPAGGTLLSLQFVDEGRKLLVASAVLEEPWRPSSGLLSPDMVFAVWNLANGELFNFHRRGVSDLLSYDVVSSYNESTGLLWSNNTGGEYWENQNQATIRSKVPKLKPIRPYAISLKQCGAPISQTIRIPVPEASHAWIELASDPGGRWIAVVEKDIALDKNDLRGSYRSRLVILNSRNGQKLAEWLQVGTLRSIVAARDGMAVFGLLVEPDPANSHINSPITLGGTWIRFDLPASLAKIPREPPAAWSPGPCSIEDEQPEARKIHASSLRPHPVFSIALTEMHAARARASMGSEDETCVGESGFESYRNTRQMWGQSEGGAIYVDRWSHLEKIDPLNGKLLARVPTPRSRDVCSLALYREQKFLSWQGDTVTLRPFSEKPRLEDREIVVSKRGWRVLDLYWLGGNQFGVTWLAARKQLNATGDSYKGHKVSNEVYSLQDKALAKVIRTWRGTADYDYQGSFWRHPFDRDQWDAARQPVAHGPFVWELGHFGSVRARVREPESKALRTILWDGLRRHVTGTPKAPTVSSVFGLGGSLGAAITYQTPGEPNAVTIYDAATRTRIASIEQPANVVDAAWVEQSRVLLIVRTQEGGKLPTSHRLIGYSLGDWGHSERTKTGLAR